MKKWICVLLCLLMLGTTVTVSAEPDENVTERTIVMEAEKAEDGTVVVWLNDDTGAAVPSWIVYLEIEDETVKTIDVDAAGAAKIDYEFPTERTKVTCLSYTGTYDTVKFVGSRIDLTALIYDEAAPTTTTEAVAVDNTTAAENTAPTDTQPTESTDAASTETTVPPTTGDQSALSLAPLTTRASQDGRIAIGVDVDNGVINASQMSAESFVIDSCMWMDPAQYAQLVSTTDASLHLQLTLHNEAGSKSNLIAAKNKDANFSSYADSEVTGFAVNTALVYVDGDLRAPLDVGDGSYKLEMPLPACFDQCEKIAVAVCTTEGLGPFVEVAKADNLSIEFERFQTIALVGFGNSAPAAGSWLDWLLWGGIVLVVIGAVILITVTFRRTKKAPVAKESKDDEVQESPRHVLLKPIADEQIESEPDLPPEEAVQKILMDFDEQAELNSSEREQFRAKDPTAGNTFDRIGKPAVSAAEQIADHQMESIRRSVANPQTPSDKLLTVDDLLDELDRDLNDLGDE